MQILRAVGNQIKHSILELVIFYANCPIIWQSKLQTTIALSTTEAEYVALSTAMRDVIYFMNLIDEMKDFGITLPGVPTPTTTC